MTDEEQDKEKASSELDTEWTFEQKMALAEELIGRYRNALRALSQSS